MFDKNTLQGEDTQDHVLVEHHLVPMRDGIRLATDVYRPAYGADMPDDSSLKPALLHRTPYDKGKAGRTERCLMPDGNLSPAMVRAWPEISCVPVYWHLYCLFA